MVIPEPPSFPSELLLAIHPLVLQLVALGTLWWVSQGDAANLLTRPEGKSSSSPTLRGSPRL